MSEIIDRILNSNQKSEGMPAVAFFTDNNPHGYCSKEGFNSTIANLDKKELRSFETLLEFMSNNIPFDNMPNIVHDHDKETCIWLRARLQRSSQNLKLPVIGDLVSFIKDYQYGKISPNFSLADLYSEAQPTENALDETV